jgi:hypothetical protein
METTNNAQNTVGVLSQFSSIAKNSFSTLVYNRPFDYPKQHWISSGQSLR